MLSEKYYPRAYCDVENLNACAAYILDQFRQAGARTSVQAFDVNQVTYKNIRALFGEESGDRLIVGAHYDACFSTPGADDNASGVAGLIELAHLLGQAKLTREIEVVAFSLEEPPFFRTDDMGSAHHARLLRAQGVEVRVMICLEMIGYFDDKKGSQRFPMPLLKLFYPDRGDFIAIVGSMEQRETARIVKEYMKGATDLPVYSFNAPRFVPGVDFSDHMNYWNQGYDAVMITDTAFYRNHEYHKRGDTADRLDYEKMANVVVAVYEAVQALSVD